jgi:hypothetical protein
MMIKKVFVGLGAIVLLAGCSEPMDLYYNEKLYQEGNLEELIEDQLENENGIDLEVNIIEEVEE